MADLNDDGNDDFVVSDRLSYELATHLGNGDGTFQQTLRPLSWCRPHGMVAADLNEDGILDLAVGSEGCGDVAIHFGLGDGWLPLTRLVRTENGVPAMIAVGDLDGDGHQDIAAPATLASPASGWGNVFLGAGDGSFSSIDAVAGTGSVAMIIADFDLDGIKDLVVTHDQGGFGSDGVDLLLGGGSGTVIPEALVLSQNNSELALAADFDNDGLPDLAVSPWGFATGGAIILINQGPFAGACMDVDGDGYGSPGDPACPGGGATDCNDGASTIHPGAVEICDSIDNDCDQIVDDGFDDDADGFSTCGGGDRDDTDGSVFPGADEVCNLIDDDCDGTVDENPDALDSCDDGYACTVDSCDTAAGCTHDASSCVGAGVAASLFENPIVDAPGQVLRLAAGDFDEDGNRDVVLGMENGVLVRFGAGDGTFAGERRILTDPPRGLTVADFDDDGHLDLAVTHDGVTIFLGAGDGSFAAGTFVPAGPFPTAIVSGTFDAGSSVDLAVTNPSSSAITILVGDGLGGFGPPETFPAGAFPRALAAGHLNADGHLDLLVANTSTDAVTVLLGDGDGTFGAPQSTPILGDAPTAVAIADFTMDGDGDAAVADLGSDEVSILVGNGDGTFGAELRTPLGDGPVELASLDLDGNGKPDLVVAERGRDRLTVLPGLGDGSFDPPLFLATGTDPTAILLTDLDGDTVTDLVAGGKVSFFNGGTVTVVKGEGGGAFSGPGSVAVGASPSFVAVGDFNEDGTADLAVANRGPSCTNTPGDLSIALGIGDGTFEPEIRFPAGLEPSAVAVGEFNDDGHQDLAVANKGCIDEGLLGSVSILLGAGDGTFTEGATFPGGDGPLFLAVGDLDLNGALDLIVADDESNQTHVFLGNGDGTFAAGVTLLEGGDSAAVADVNGDLLPDLILDSPSSYLLGNGDGTFQAAVIIDFQTSPLVLTIGDFNGDGRTDVAGRSQIALGNPDGTVAPAIGSGFGLPESILVAADLNLDGQLDLVSSVTNRNRIRVELGAGDGSLAPPAAFSAGGDARSLAVGDFNGDGRTDVAAVNQGSDTVSVSLNQGPGSGCLDGDGDGFGVPGNPACAGGLQPDCDDLDASRFPGAPDTCDMLDNDCDLRIDEGPDPVQQVRLLHLGPTSVQVEWDPQPASELYEVHGGSISGLYDHVPFACALNQTFFIDNSVLPVGFGFYYLIRGTNACSLGSLGSGSFGKRPVLIPCT